MSVCLSALIPYHSFVFEARIGTERRLGWHDGPSGSTHEADNMTYLVHVACANRKTVHLPVEKVLLRGAAAAGGFVTVMRPATTTGLCLIRHQTINFIYARGKTQ